MNNLSDKAILVGLTISQWSGRKFDRKATQEVNDLHATKDAGRFNKLLIEGDGLRKITQVSGEIRTFHYKNTLAWSDFGERLLPSANYFTYTQKLSDLIRNFNDAVGVFVSEYDDLIADSKVRLNGLFNPNDYPTKVEIESKFKVLTSFQPLPQVSNDFRLSVGSTSEADRIRQEVEAEIAIRHNTAMEDVFQKAKDVINRITVTLKNPDGRFQRTMIDNVSELVEMIPVLNYTNDPKLAKLTKEMKSLVVDPDAIRSDQDVRTNYHKRAQQLEKLFF